MKSLIYFFFFLCTAIIGNTINNSLFWAVVNFFFAPISWLICKDVSIIKESFRFFLE